MCDEGVRHDSFSTFVTTPPLKGLGASEDLIRRLVGCDTGLHDLIDRHMARPSGRPASSTSSDDTEPCLIDTVLALRAPPRPQGFVSSASAHRTYCLKSSQATSA